MRRHRVFTPVRRPGSLSRFSPSASPERRVDFIELLAFADLYRVDFSFFRP